MQFLKKHVQRIRQKPLYVRERILIVLMAVITPALFTLWFATFNFSQNSNTASVIKSVTGTISSVSSDPEFKKAFVQPTFVSPGADAVTPTASTPAGTDSETADDATTSPSYNSSFGTVLDDSSAQ